MPLHRECTVGFAAKHRDRSKRIALARYDWPQPRGLSDDHVASRKGLHSGKLLRAHASDFFIRRKHQCN
jgi:hypothetical protein